MHVKHFIETKGICKNTQGKASNALNATSLELIRAGSVQSSRLSPQHKREDKFATA